MNHIVQLIYTDGEHLYVNDDFGVLCRLPVNSILDSAVYFLTSGSKDWYMN